MKDDTLINQALSTQRAAERVAKLMGCSGAHRTAEGWFPCESPRKLRALLTGGVASYRKIKADVPVETKLLGSILRAATGRSDTHIGDRRGGKRKLRHVPVDPNARDADGDNLLQEGTTAERSARAARKPVATAKRTAATVTPKRKRPIVQPIKKGPKPAPPAVLSGAEKAQHTILHDRIKAIGGIGAVRTKEQGPLPRVATRGKIIHSRLERRFGTLDTMDDYDKALKRTFPNARFDSLAVAVKPTDAPDQENIASYQILRRFSDEDALAQFYDPENPEQIKATIKGFYDAILESGLNDEKAAKRVGRVSLAPPKSNFLAMVGTSATNSIDAPITIHMNPKSTSDEARLSESAAVLGASMMMMRQLSERDEIKKRGMGGNLFTTALTNGDTGLIGMATGFHEWSHVSGLSRAVDDIPTAEMDELKEWTRTGEVFPESLKTGLFSSPEMFDLWSQTMDSMVGIGKDEANAPFAKRVARSLGFGEVDIGDQEAMTRVWRAYATRTAVAYRAMDMWDERVDKISEKDWQRMDTVSGYANVNREEALAELHSLYYMYPEHAATRYRRAIAHPEFVSRLP